MAYSEIVEGGRRQKAACEYVLDSTADLDSIPTDLAGPGSMAIVPSAGEIYMMTPAGEWVLYGGG